MSLQNNLHGEAQLTMLLLINCITALMMPEIIKYKATSY